MIDRVLVPTDAAFAAMAALRPVHGGRPPSIRARSWLRICRLTQIDATDEYSRLHAAGRSFFAADHSAGHAGECAGHRPASFDMCRWTFLARTWPCPRTPCCRRLSPCAIPCNMRRKCRKCSMPDVLTTGEVNLLTRHSAKFAGRSKVGSARRIGRAARRCVADLLLIPSLFTTRQPTQAEIIAASHSAGRSLHAAGYAERAAPGSARRSGQPSKIHIDPKAIRQLAPPEPTAAPRSEVPAPAVRA